MPLSISKKFKFVIYFLIFVFVSTIFNYDLVNYKSEFFLLKNVKIFGANKNLENKINEKIQPFLNQSILNIRKNDFENIFENFNFLDSYSVLKKYPSSIHIKIKYTTPIATTITNGKKFYLGSNGNLINISEEIDYSNLPVIFGKFDPKNFLKLNDLLISNDFKVSSVTEYYYFSSGRWDIKTKDDNLIKLPSKDIVNNIILMKRIIKNNNFKKKIIDLRVPNQVIININE